MFIAKVTNYLACIGVPVIKKDSLSFVADNIKTIFGHIGSIKINPGAINSFILGNTYEALIFREYPCLQYFFQSIIDSYKQGAELFVFTALFYQNINISAACMDGDSLGPLFFIEQVRSYFLLIPWEFFDLDRGRHNFCLNRTRCDLNWNDRKLGFIHNIHVLPISREADALYTCFSVWVIKEFKGLGILGIALQGHFKDIFFIFIADCPQRFT